MPSFRDCRQPQRHVAFLGDADDCGHDVEWREFLFRFGQHGANLVAVQHVGAFGDGAAAEGADLFRDAFGAVQFKIEQGKMLAPLENKLRTIIETIGKEQGFALILQRNNPYLIYSREALDITDLVIEKYNQKG